MKNNINVGGLKDFSELVVKNPDKTKVTKSVDGEWSLNDGDIQFTATLSFDQDNSNIKCELPSIMGGWGRAPDPVQYCLFGLGACYLSTFASVATLQDVKLDELKIRIENQMDLKKQLGLSDEDIVKQLKFIVEVKSDVTREVLQTVKELADNRCPGVECLTRQIPLSIELL